jgi:peptide/nickel transport system substrate-binding protein
MAIVAGALASGAMLCGPGQAQTRGGTLTYATTGEIGSLDPHASGSLVELEMIHHLFEGLVAMDERHGARPMLAEAVEMSADAREYRFRLRQGVRFHDGERMSSADVVASFQRYAQVSGNAAMLDGVASYDTPDASTFVVRLRTPNAVLLDQMKTTTYPLAILPARQKDRPAQEVDPVGTGPFMLEEWEKASHLLLRRNEGYAPDRSAPGPDGLAGRKTVYLDMLDCRFMAEPRQRLSALRAGEVDVAANLTPNQARRIRGQAGLVAQKVFPYCQLVLVANTAEGPTAQPLVRQAIQAAVDVEAVLATVGSMGRRNPALTYPGSAYGGETAARFYDRGDAAQARALLAQAGYRGETLVLQTNTTFSYMRDAILVVAQQLRDAGFTTEVQVVDFLTNTSNLRRGTGGWHLTAAGYCTQPLLGPQQWRNVLLRLAPPDDRAVLDAAYGRFFAGTTLEARRAAWETIEMQVLSQGVLTKLADIGVVRGHAERVQGLTPFFIPRFWNTWVN